MSARFTRYSAAWVLPVISAPIRDGAVLVNGTGTIVAVGPEDVVPFPAEALAEDLGEAALLPGLVNAHAHLDLCMFRGCIEDLDFPDWIARLLELKRNAALTSDDYRVAARWSCIESLRAGITAIGTTDDSDGSIVALRESGQRGVVFREVFGPAADQSDSAMRLLHEQVAAMRELETDLVRIGISPHAPYSVSKTLFIAAAEYARSDNLPIAVHAAESRAETELITRGRGAFAEHLRARGILAEPARSTIDLLARTGILSLAPLLVHAVHADFDDIELMKRHGVKVAHCPAANARLGHGIAPIRRFLEAGICVALGSDSVASNNRMDILEEARLAQLLQRSLSGSALALDAQQLLCMATMDGARALGIADRSGSLEPGKDADLCAVKFEGAHVRPLHDPLAALFHSARAADVVLTVVRGRVLYRDGWVTSIDADRTRADIDALGARVRRTAALGAERAPVRTTP